MVYEKTSNLRADGFDHFARFLFDVASVPMKQIDAEPRNYRAAPPNQRSPYALWFWGALIAALCVGIWSRNLGNEYALLLMFLAAFTVGANYARWSAGSEPVFKVGGLSQFWGFVAAIAIVLVVGWVLRFILPLEWIYDTAYSASCNITGGC